jgi:UPF0716 protein FxsA
MVFLVALFILVPIVELWAILQVGQLIGVIPTVALLLVDSIVGIWLLRHQGRLSWRRFRETLAAGRVPANETADGALVIFGGALLITPGFVTDILGLLMLIPGSRDLIRRIVIRRAVIAGATSVGGPAGWTVRGMDWGRRGARARSARRQPSETRPPARQDFDVEGTAVDADRPGLRSQQPHPGT